jgi:hypothetical protein
MARAREYDDLKNAALCWWPDEILHRQKDASIIPALIATQDKFISLLHIADSAPDAWKVILPRTTGLPANLFLKHLMVLSDLGGEPLKRLKTELPGSLQGTGMRYRWHDRDYEYEFKTFGKRASWSNKVLGVEGDSLKQPVGLTPAMEDVITLIMHGASSLEPGIPTEVAEKCVIGSLLGNKKELDVFVRQRYIWVSRITGGAAANALGYLAEAYVKERLQDVLPEWDFSKKTIPGISQNEGRTDMSFDRVAESPGHKYCAIELSFQVTTNSTIERKAGQARSRQQLLRRRGHRIAYVIDGAGNFERRSALSTIWQYSDCTVTFKDSEIQSLVAFLKGL